MHVSVTFRHVEPTAALRTYAEEKLVRVKKYLRRPVDAHVILSVSKERHVAEITLKADHVTMFAQEETHDLYSAIDEHPGNATRRDADPQISRHVTYDVYRSRSCFQSCSTAFY